MQLGLAGGCMGCTIEYISLYYLLRHGFWHVCTLGWSDFENKFLHFVCCAKWLVFHLSQGLRNSLMLP